MLATIRVRENGSSYELCKLDLMRFSEEQVRDRMAERGFRDESFFICGISDWEVDRILELKEAYQLVTVIHALYDGDEYVVSEMLRKNKTIKDIVFSAYSFVGKMEDEKEVLKDLLQHEEPARIVDFWYSQKTPANMLRYYEDIGYVLLTQKGIYKNVSEC
ncbi:MULTISPECIES: hypothetical protein [Streptococcus]|uniref:Uncharacterized protein n=1 Tax=Streptococcus caledonicus TaxID=2614158 RepID=A0ABW0UEL2_9STRE|nr:hypothetical protein [Streptococcus sp. S784/96/1]